MKNILLGTSALVAAGLLAAPASAAEKIKLGLGGKMEQYFGVVSQDDTDDYDPTMTGINTDVEVYFTGATTLDNGLTVGAVVQLEAQTNATTNADEQYAYIEGAFGRITAGQKEGVLTALAHEAPQYGLADDDITPFFNPGNSIAGFGDNRLVDTTLGGQDTAGVSYMSPTIAGFSFGASFFPNPEGALQDNTIGGLVDGPDADSIANDDVAFDTSNQWEAAIAYNGEIAGFGIGADVAYLSAQADDSPLAGIEFEDPNALRAGLLLSYAGFQVGGGYLNLQNNNGVDGQDSQIWNAGVGYKTGPFGVSFTYLNSAVELSPVTDDEANYDQYSLHGTYSMGPGITLATALFYAEGELDLAGDAADEDTDAVGGIVGLQLAF